MKDRLHNTKLKNFAGQEEFCIGRPLIAVLNHCHPLGRSRGLTFASLPGPAQANVPVNGSVFLYPFIDCLSWTKLQPLQALENSVQRRGRLYRHAQNLPRPPPTLIQRQL